MGDATSRGRRLANLIVVVITVIACAPLALVTLYPWRDPMGPRPVWAAVAAYAVLVFALIWAVFG